MLAVYLNEFHDLVDFHTAEAACALQNNGIKPKLGDLLLTFHVDMRRFASIQRDEEKAISVNSQNRGYPVAILSHRCRETFVDRWHMVCADNGYTISGKRRELHFHTAKTDARRLAAATW